MSERLDHVGTEINPATFENETLAFLHDYWNAKRGIRAMPSRADIKASEMREHLGWVMLIEALPDLSDFRYKLIGTLVTQYFLADSTGKNIAGAFEKSERPEVATKAVKAMFRKCARDKVVVHCFGDAEWIGKGFESFNCICLPLSDDGETVNMILHAFVFDRSDVLLAREVARANGGRLPSISVRGAN